MGPQADCLGQETFQFSVHLKGSHWRVVRLTTMLREQMIEVMPELAEIGRWPNYGSRRTTDQLGRIGVNPIDVSGLNIH